MNIRILFRKISFVALLMITPILFESCITTALLIAASQESKSKKQNQKQAASTSTNNSKTTTKDNSKGTDKNEKSNSDKNDKSGIVRLQCLGEGNTRHEAINDALRFGLEQVYGTFISSDTKILNDKVIKDEIVSLFSGNVTDYKVLTESNVGNTWIVTLEGGFSQQKLAKYVESKGGSVTVSTSAYAQNILIEKAQKAAKEKLMRQKVEKAERIAPLCVDYKVEVFGPCLSECGKYLINVGVYAVLNENYEDVRKLLADVPRRYWEQTNYKNYDRYNFADFYCDAKEHYRLYRDGIDITERDTQYFKISDLYCESCSKPEVSYYFIQIVHWQTYKLTFEELQNFQSEFRVEYKN